jgi:predicted alpha/beta superfamily hydrolase
LYLHDGQNLFDPAAAAFGVSWQAHATADRLIARRRIEPIIMVGIANTPDRIDEYTFHHDPARKAGGRGRFYARFVLDEVKPFIDATYRTRPGREHTAIAGSSLGGLVSLTMAWDDHDRFALCGVLSPSLWWCRERVLRDLGRRPAWMRSVRFWLDVGAREGAQPAEQWANVLRARRLVEIFDAAGLLPGPDYYYAEVADGEHSEAAWAARFDRVLLYFFGRRDSALPGQGATG